MKLFYILPLIAILFFGCKKDDPPVIWEGEDYFPLEVGNSWHYGVFSEEITKIIDINGINYFEMSVVYTGSTHTIYYRKDQEGNIFRRQKIDEEDELIYKLNMETGEKWIRTVPFGDEKVEWNCTLVSKKEEFTLGDHILKNCYQFGYDVEAWVDEEHTTFLAPGIGKIKDLSYAWGVDMILNKAVIGGVTYSFE